MYVFVCKFKIFSLLLLALEKAHQHMEDSHVAAYSALLIGLLAEGNKVRLVFQKLQPEFNQNSMYCILLMVWAIWVNLVLHCLQIAAAQKKLILKKNSSTGTLANTLHPNRNCGQWTKDLKNW